MNKPFTCFLFITLLLILSLAVVAELAFRLYRYGTVNLPPEAFVYDPFSAYVYNPRKEGFAGGFRGGAPAREKQAGVTRIVCVGESITSGDFIADLEKTWPSILERYLAAPDSSGYRCEVYNAAVGGYGTRHILGMLRHRIAAFHPDKVIIYAGSGGNGLVNSVLWAPFPIVTPQDSRIARMDKFLYTRVTVYRVIVRHRIEPFLADHAGLANARGDCFREISFDNVAGDIGDCVDVITSSRAEPIVVLFPVWKEKGQASRGNGFMDSLKATVAAIGDTARSHKARVVDMRGLFDGVRSNRFFSDYHHLRAEGCERFARALADSLAMIDGLR